MITYFKTRNGKKTYKKFSSRRIALLLRRKFRQRLKDDGKGRRTRWKQGCNRPTRKYLSASKFPRVWTSDYYYVHNNCRSKRKDVRKEYLITNLWFQLGMNYLDSFYNIFIENVPCRSDWYHVFSFSSRYLHSSKLSGWPLVGRSSSVS